MNEKYVINIGRQLGSGGRIIGKKLAESLGISFYDKELIGITAKESGLGKEFFEKADEKTKFGFFGTLLGLVSGVGGEGYTDNYLQNETLFKIQSDVIRELAEKNSCVFVGRCADYILRNHPRCVNIFVCADPGDRIERIVEYEKISPDKARSMVERVDKQRTNYYNYYTGKEWGVAASYHLCINTSLLGIEKTTEYIRSYVASRLEI
ncbi:MAG: cytidylate kinase-like family protein [Dysgonamonadaceae bacterium]|jgi:cytidylate kinase|nr:cytidylate kinase-like family protein [Dysgonamonadaceae bacterium]